MEQGALRIRILERLSNKVFEASQFCNGSFREQGKGNGANARRQFGGGQNITDDSRCFLQSALPMRLAGIAKDEAVGVESGCSQYSASHFQEFLPARGHADQRTRRGRKVSGKRGWNGANLQDEKLRARWHQLTNCCFAIQEENLHSAFRCSRTIFHATRLDREDHRARDLGCQDSTQFLIGLNQKEMIGRLQLQPLPQAESNLRKGDAELPRRSKQPRDHLVNGERGSRGCLGFAGPNVNPAAMAELDPLVAFELPVPGADRVGMQVESPRQFACTRQTLSGRKIVAQDAEDDLRDQLFADRYFAGARKPELHGGNMVEQVLSSQLSVLSQFRSDAQTHWQPRPPGNPRKPLTP